MISGIWSYLPLRAEHTEKRTKSSKKVPDTTTLDVSPNVRLKTMADKKTLAKIEEFGLGWLNQKITGIRRNIVY